MKISSISEFEKIIQTKAIILFSADYCGDCRIFKPTFEKVRAMYPNAPIYQLDTAEFSELAQKVGIRSIPTVRFYQHGENQATLGNHTETSFRDFVRQTIL